MREVELDRFFAPRAVAVIGASDTEGGVATMNYRLLRGWLDPRGVAVHPVNPNRETVDGERCYPSILDVPGDVDVAVLLVGADAAVAALEEAVQRKVPFAVLFGAGFSESGDEGAERQREVEELVASSDIRVLGPNTTLNAFQPFDDSLPGRAIALITQSGHQGRPIYQGQEIGIRVSHWAPTGNEADLESADFVRYFADQDEVGAIAAYLEGSKDGSTLVAALDHAATQGVPVVVVKVGRTDVGRSWAQSHSGHLAGSDQVTSAVFRQYGVTRVDTLDELLDTSMLFCRTPPPTTDGVAIYSISGGTGAHMADLAAAFGLRLPQLSEETQRQLHEWIPPFLRVSNPVDSGGHPTADWRGPLILRAILDDPEVGVLVVPIAGSFSPISEKFAQDLVDVAAETEEPICVVWGSPSATEEAYRDILLRSELPVFRSARNCLTAVRAYLDHHAFRQRYSTAVRGPAGPGFALRSGALSEHASKELLRAYGIPTTDDRLVGSGEEAAAAFRSLGGPVVLKACGPSLLHKSDRGLVEVGVATEEAVRETYARLVEASEEGVLVCPLVTGGVETIVGVVRDELFGPTVMFGIGGIAVEVYRDVTFRVPPFTTDEAHRMVREVRALPLLEGARGRPAADLDAIVDTLMAVQRLALDLEDDLVELDINPLLARPDGVVALDALAIGR